MSNRTPRCRDGWESVVVPGLGFCRGAPAEAVHEPAGVVPVGPCAGDSLQVGEGPGRDSPPHATALPPASPPPTYPTRLTSLAHPTAHAPTDGHPDPQHTDPDHHRDRRALQLQGADPLCDTADVTGIAQVTAVFSLPAVNGAQTARYVPGRTQVYGRSIRSQQTVSCDQPCLPETDLSAIMELRSDGRAAITKLTTSITLLTMVMACVSEWAWSSGSQDHSFRRWGGGSGGEEDVRNAV